MRRLAAVALALSAAAVACSGSGTGGTSSGSTNSSTSTSSAAGGSCASACTYQLGNHCPMASQFGSSVTDCTSSCENAALPSACLLCLSATCLESCTTSCAGLGTTTTGSGVATGLDASASSTGTSSLVGCGTGVVSADISMACTANGQCGSDGVCNTNTSSPAQSYCTNLCGSTADCPCQGSWSCTAIGGALGTINFYCKDDGIN